MAPLQKSEIASPPPRLTLTQLPPGADGPTAVDVGAPTDAAYLGAFAPAQQTGGGGGGGGGRGRGGGGGGGEFNESEAP
jgi:hypothetical protein